MTKFGLELKKIMKFENLRTFFRPLRSISGPLEALDPLGPRKWVKVLKVFFQKQLRKWKSDGNWVQESSGKVSYPIAKSWNFQISNFKFAAGFISWCADLQKLMNIKDFFEEMDGGGWPESENVFLFAFWMILTMLLRKEKLQISKDSA